MLSKTLLMKAEIKVVIPTGFRKLPTGTRLRIGDYCLSSPDGYTWPELVEEAEWYEITQEDIDSTEGGKVLPCDILIRRKQRDKGKKM
jgi:hypothetical protein